MHVLMVAAAPPYHQAYMQHFQSMEDNRLIWLFVWAIIADILTGLARSLVSHHTLPDAGCHCFVECSGRHDDVLHTLLCLFNYGKPRADGASAA